MRKDKEPTVSTNVGQYSAIDVAYRHFVINAVNNGAAYLDMHYPGWAHRVDLGLFNMMYPEMNILAHIHGTYVYDCPEWLEWSIKSLTAHGFYVPDNEYYSSDVLTLRWRTVILDRRKGL